MIRLLLLIALTLAAGYGLLAVYGDPLPRSAPPATRAETSESVAAPPETSASEASATRAEPAGDAQDLVQATSQTPQQVQRFPGPALRPSPQYADRVPPAAPRAESGGQLARITGSRVNMRAGPSTADAVLTSLGRGTAVQALGPLGGDWVHVRAPDGQRGYVSGQFLEAAD